MSNPVFQFIEERIQRIRGNGGNSVLKSAAAAFNEASNTAQYS